MMSRRPSWFLGSSPIIPNWPSGPGFQEGYFFGSRWVKGDLSRTSGSSGVILS